MSNLRRLMCTVALGLWAVALALPAQADAVDTLDTYLRSVRSGQTAFTQTLSSTGKDGKPTAGKRSSGVFAFERPARFRFDYQQPFVQTIVADGKHLWLYDADLNQVTRRVQADVLDATPAALIASASSVAALQKHFRLTPTPVKDKLQWLEATPLNAQDNPLRNVRIGFEGDALRRLDFTDRFGQRSIIEFGTLQALPASTRFDFKPPAGADVLQQ